VSAFLTEALRHSGAVYRFGVEVSTDDPNPSAFDCSELIQHAAGRLGVTPTMPDGSWLQARHCRQHVGLVPITQALATPGALLFRFSADPFTGARPPSSHVAISLGDGRTMEARSTAHGVGVFGNAAMRTWTHAARIPGVSYSAGTPPAPEPHAWAADAWAAATAAGVLTTDSRPDGVVTDERLMVFLHRLGLFGGGR
jgi:hypothetical protein